MSHLSYAPHRKLLTEISANTLVSAAATEPLLLSLEIRSGLRTGWIGTLWQNHSPNVITTETTLAGGLPVNGINLVTFPAAAAIMAFASDDANDTSAGTGLRTMRITYLDSTYTEQTETITLNGTTKVASVNTMLRINLMEGLTAGSSGQNAGNIYVGLNTDTFTAGAPDTAVFHTMEVTRNLSACGVYTVPNGKRFYSESLDASSDASGNKTMVLKSYQTNFGGLRMVFDEEVSNGGGFAIPTQSSPFAVAGSDMESTGRASTGIINASFFTSFWLEDVPDIF